MTDATQTEILATQTRSAAHWQKAFQSRPGYLFGPAVDFLMLGGGSLIVCGAILFLFPKGISTTSQAALVVLLMTLINQPHFAHSYQMFYRGFYSKAFGPAYSRDLRRRYIVAGLIVPSALILFLAGSAIAGSVKALSYGVNLMFLLVGWHYVKQGYGILIVDSVQKRLMFSETTKRILRLNAYACWMVAWFGLNPALARSARYIGISYSSFPIPSAFLYGAIALATVTSLAVLALLGLHWRSKGRRLPWNGVIAYLAALYLWVIFVRINPLLLAVVPTFHSLQYLAVVWRYQLNAGNRKERATPPASFARLDRVWPASPMRSFLLFVTAGMLLGYLGFMGIPRLIDWALAYDKQFFGPSLFVFMAYIFINVHHYFLDNVMWRRGNPDVQQYIFARPSRELSR